jgi:tight adherence protein B
MRDRIDRIVGRGEYERLDAAAAGDKVRRRRVRESLRELRAREIGRARRRANPTMTGLIRQAGLNMTLTTFYITSAAVGVACWAIPLILTDLGFLISLALGIAGALFLPRFYVNFRRGRRLQRFGDEFPTALDMIVRGVRTGLPLVDCIKTISTETEDPMREEFAQILSDQALGVPLNEAVQRLADRVPITDTAFFAIVIGIQSRTGGNLSEALSNLSKVIRARRQLAGKIKAMSAEAKASAAIIGSLPPSVALVLYFASRDYIMLLFTTTGGNITLACSGAWMLLGILMMRGMINFDY